MKTPTQPLSACSICGEKNINTQYGHHVCSDIATPEQTIKAQTVSGTSVNVSSTKTIPTQNIATPDTEDDLDKTFESFKYKLGKIIPAEVYSRNQYGGTTRRMKLSDEEIEDLFNLMNEIKGSCRQLIRTEKLKVVEAVKLEKKEHEEGEHDKTFDWKNGYNAAYSDLNAIREKIKTRL